MKTLIAILTFLAVVLVMPAMAGKKGNKSAQDTTPELKILEVNAVGISVEAGAGDEHIAYKITDNTKVTLNGAKVEARDLRPGMVAKIEAGKDKVATSIRAKDAPTHPGRHRVG